MKRQRRDALRKGNEAKKTGGEAANATMAAHVEVNGAKSVKQGERRAAAKVAKTTAGDAGDEGSGGGGASTGGKGHVGGAGAGGPRQGGITGHVLNQRWVYRLTPPVCVSIQW